MSNQMRALYKPTNQVFPIKEIEFNEFGGISFILLIDDLGIDFYPNIDHIEIIEGNARE